MVHYDDDDDVDDVYVVYQRFPDWSSFSLIIPTLLIASSSSIALQNYTMLCVCVFFLSTSSGINYTIFPTIAKIRFRMVYSPSKSIKHIHNLIIMNILVTHT